MTTANYDVPQRERGSELKELNFAFQEQGKRLSDVLTKITSIGNKLSDESGMLTEKPAEPKEPTNRLPGLISDISSTVNGYRAVISQIETQLKKLDSLI